MTLQCGDSAVPQKCGAPCNPGFVCMGTFSDNFVDQASIDPWKQYYSGSFDRYNCVLLSTCEERRKQMGQKYGYESVYCGASFLSSSLALILAVIALLAF